MLPLIDFKEEFCIGTDACGQGLGVILHQRGKSMVYFNKGLGVRYRALSIYDKEMLAVLAVKKWHTYLVGKKF